MEEQRAKFEWPIAIIVVVLVLSAYTFLVVRPMARSVVAEVHDSGYPKTIYDLRLHMGNEDAARFIDEYMPTLQACSTRRELLKKSVEAATVDGLYCEFGVATGGTINYIASLTAKPIHGFDSFEGLPEDWRDGMAKGYFARTGLPKVRSNVILHKGWFDQVLPGWKTRYAGPLAFVHMDADLYSSTKTVLDSLADRMVPGTIIQFDEFFMYPGWKLNGEYKAFTEFRDAHNLQFEFLGYSVESGQVAVKVKGLTLASLRP
jgi:Macrocin-O-methyltransferase (TylF)